MGLIDEILSLQKQGFTDQEIWKKFTENHPDYKVLHEQNISDEDILTKLPLSPFKLTKEHLGVLETPQVIPKTPGEVQIATQPELPGVKQAGLMTDIPKLFGKGMAVGTQAGIMGGVGNVLYQLGETIKRIPEDPLQKLTLGDLSVMVDVAINKLGGKPKEVKDKMYKKVGKYISDMGIETEAWWREQASKGIEAPDPKILQGSFMDYPFRKSAYLIGQAIPSFAAAVMITQITKNPWMGAAALGGLEGVGMYKEARVYGVSHEKAQAAMAASTLGTTLLEFFPMNMMIKGTSGKISKPLFMLLVSQGEGVEEVLQAIWNNMIVKVGWDKTRKWYLGILEGYIAGVGSAGMISGFSTTMVRDVSNIEGEAKAKGMTGEDLGLAKEQIGSILIDNADKVDETVDKLITERAKERRTKMRGKPTFMKPYGDNVTTWLGAIKKATDGRGIKCAPDYDYTLLRQQPGLKTVVHKNTGVATDEVVMFLRDAGYLSPGEAKDMSFDDLLDYIGDNTYLPLVIARDEMLDEMGAKNEEEYYEKLAEEENKFKEEQKKLEEERITLEKGEEEERKQAFLQTEARGGVGGEKVMLSPGEKAEMIDNYAQQLGTSPEKLTLVNTAELKVGDEFQIKGEDYNVGEVTEDGKMIIIDGFTYSPWVGEYFAIDKEYGVNKAGEVAGKEKPEVITTEPTGITSEAELENIYVGDMKITEFDIKGLARILKGKKKDLRVRQAAQYLIYQKLYPLLYKKSWTWLAGQSKVMGLDLNKTSISDMQQELLSSIREGLIENKTWEDYNTEYEVDTYVGTKLLKRYGMRILRTMKKSIQETKPLEEEGVEKELVSRQDVEEEVIRDELREKTAGFIKTLPDNEQTIMNNLLYSFDTPENMAAKLNVNIKDITKVMEKYKNYVKAEQLFSGIPLTMEYVRSILPQIDNVITLLEEAGLSQPTLKHLGTYLKRWGGIIGKGLKYHLGRESEMMEVEMGEELGKKIYMRKKLFENQLATVQEAIQIDMHARLKKAGLHYKSRAMAFDVIEGIKGVDEKGEMIFGAMHRAKALPIYTITIDEETIEMVPLPVSDEETEPTPLAEIKQGRRLYDGRIVGEIIEVTGKRKIQLYREITEAEARLLYEDFAEKYPKAVGFIKDYIADNEIIKKTVINAEIPPFSREVLKEWMNLSPEATVEAYIRHQRREPRTITGKIVRGLRRHINPSERYRQGILREEGRLVTDVGEAISAQRIEATKTQLFNVFLQDVLEMALIPIPSTMRIPDGYFEFTTGAFKGGPYIIKAIEAMEKNGKLEEMGLEKEDVYKGTFLLRGKRYIIPESLVDILQGIDKTEPANSDARLFTRMAEVAINSGYSMVFLSWLTKPSTAQRNFVSGAIQHSVKISSDFWTGIFHKILRVQNDPYPMAEFRYDIQALITVLAPSVRHRLPAGMLGMNFYQEVLKSTGENPILQTFLSLFMAYETYFKRVTAESELRPAAERAYRKALSENAVTTENKEQFIESFVNNIPLEAQQKAYDAIRIYPFDYADKARLIKAQQRNIYTKGLIPYVNYFYNLARLVGTHLNPQNLMAMFDPKTTTEEGKVISKVSAAVRAKRLGQLMGMISVLTILRLVIGRIRDKLRGAIFSEGRVPYEVDASGRLKIWEDDENEYWVRVLDLPLLGDMVGMIELGEGKITIGDWIGNRISVGMSFTIPATLLGYSNQYNKYVPPSAQFGSEVASYVLLSPYLTYMRYMLDPYKRKYYDYKKGAFENFIMGFSNYMPGLSSLYGGEIRKDREGNPIEIDPVIASLSMFVLNFKRIDKDEWSMAVKELEERLKKKYKKADTPGKKESIKKAFEAIQEAEDRMVEANDFLTDKERVIEIKPKYW